MTVRLAAPADVEFLAANAHIAAGVIRQKVNLREFFVAVSGNEVLGFLQLEYLWSKVPFVALIWVLPRYRRRGIGCRILAFVENYLFRQGFHALYSSSQANEPEPQAWHRDAGFTECGAIRGINDGVDEVFFCKRLLRS